jgi:hypothetical protein
VRPTMGGEAAEEAAVGADVVGRTDALNLSGWEARRWTVVSGTRLTVCLRGGTCRRDGGNPNSLCPRLEVSLLGCPIFRPRQGWTVTGLGLASEREANEANEASEKVLMRAGQGWIQS